jgi:hypothetical protein
LVAIFWVIIPCSPVDGNLMCPSPRHKYFCPENPSDICTLCFCQHENFNYLEKLDIAMAMNRNITIILDVTPCSRKAAGDTCTIQLDYRAPQSRLAKAVLLLTCI